MKRVPLIALVLLAAVLVTPASALIGYLPDSAHVAYSDTTRYIDLNAYDPNGEVIADVLFNVPPGTKVDFTLYAYNDEITGEINRTLTGPNSEIVTYRIGDHTAGPYEMSGGLFGLLGLGQHTYSLRYGASSESPGVLEIWLQSHQFSIGREKPVTAINDVAYRMSVTATNDIELTITTAPSDDMHTAISEIWDLGDEGIFQFISLLRGLFAGVYLVISLGWYVFRKIFIENFLLFAGLFEVIGMAYAANKSRDIFQFFRKVVDYNVSAFKGMYWLIEKMVTIITRIINALNPLG